MGIFDGLIDQANQVLTQPTPSGGGSGLPWDTGSASKPATWTGYGPQGQGTYYLDGPGGSPGTYIGPTTNPSGGGGGGSTNPSTIYIQNNPGQLYQDIVSDGNDGYPAGTVYQVNAVTGQVTIKYKPAAAVNPADKNNDGLDDTTNWALGVYQDKNSPTGYSYGQGQPVYPNGAPYQGGASGGGGLDFNNTKTVGGVLYVLDTAKGQYVPAPGINQTSGPGSTSSSGGGSYTVSGPRVSSISSGGGSSGGTARDYAAEQAAQNAAQAQMQKDAQAFNASQNALDRAQRDQEFQANYGLSVQQFQAQQAKDAAAARLGLIDRYGAAVSDTDQAKLQSLRMALSPNGTGDVSLVDLLRNAGPGAFQANEAAAALLGEIRGQPASPTGTGMAPVTTPTGATGAGTPATGTPGMTPVTGATDPAVAAAQQAAAAAQQDATIRANLAANQRGADQQTISQNNSAITAWYDPKNWTNIGNNNPTGGGVDYMKSTITGESIPMTVWSQMMQDNKSATQLENERVNFWQGASVTPGYGGLGYNSDGTSGAQYGHYVGLKVPAVDALGQVSGMSSQTIDPTWANYTGPTTGGTMSYGNDNVSNPMPTGNLANDNIMRQLPPTQTQAVLPMLANGTERPQMGPIVTGDPQVPGQPNPELTVWTPQGNIVRPLNQMHPMMRPVMDAMPHAAFGTSVFTNPWARFGGSSPLSGSTTPTTTQTAIPAIPKTATTGVDATTMVGTTSTPGQTSYTPMTPLTAPSTIPSGQQSATVPTSSYPNTGTMQPVTQPQPTTVGGTTVTTTPTPNPADPLALTPQSTQYINDVASFRTNLQYPHLNQLDVSWGRLAPSLQQSNMQGVQTSTGIPVADQQFWQNRFAFAGRPTMAAVAGY